jgi:PAS domain S-box-containing protein
MAALLLLPLLLLLLLGVVYSVLGARSSARWATHTDEVRLELLRLRSNLVDAETGQRGYLATGDALFLEPYDRGVRRWRAVFDEVRRSTVDNRDQQRRLDELQPLIEHKLDEMGVGVDARRQGATGAALVPLLSSGKEAMDDIRARIAAMQREEEALNRKRAAATTRLATFSIAGLFSATLLLVVGGAWVLAARRAEQISQEREQRDATLVREVIDNLPGLAWTALPDGRLDFYNQSWVEYTGANLDDETAWEKLHDPEVFPRVDERWKRSLATGEPFEMEFPLRGKDGVFRWFLTRVRPLHDSQGRIVRWVGSNTNVDEVRRANERYRGIFEQAAVGMAEVSLDGRWIRVNDRLCEIFGYTREELEQRTFREITYPEDRETDAANTRQLLTGARPTFTREKRYVRKNGSPVWARLTVALVRTPSGSPDYFISVIEDIDEAKRNAIERALLLEREQSARQEAERAAKLAELFVAVLGHDLRNPLNAIQMSGTLLARRGDEPTQQVAARITSSAQRMARMIEQILDFSRIRSGHGLPQKPTTMDLRDVLSRVVQELASTNGEKRVSIDMDGDTRGRWDDDRLAQVFSNLIGNALEHSPEGAAVRVSVDARDATSVEIAIQNPGAIPGELVAELFEPFRKARQNAKSRGLGLGLYITKQIVEAHGGTIDVTTSEGGGTRFRVVLPRSAA